MDTIKPSIELPQVVSSRDAASISEPLKVAHLSMGSGFDAQSFRAREIGEVMDPLVMVDHYVMTEPTFYDLALDENF